MKNTIYILLLCFVTIGSQAQTDSVYRKEMARKVNELRKSNNLMPIQLNQNLNRAAENILKKGNTFKDKDGNYIKDSIRRELRFKGIHDYQVEISESTGNENNELIKGEKQTQSVQKAKMGPKYNSMGVAKSKNHEVIVLSKHYVEFDSMVSLSASIPDFATPELQLQTAIINGNTELNNLTICIYDKKANVETDEPLSRKPLVKEGNNFEIELDVTNTQPRIPFKITLVDEKGIIISQFNLSNV